MRKKDLLKIWQHKAESAYMHFSYSRQFKKYLKINHIPNKRIEGEDEYINFWKRLSNKVEPYSYRLFNRFKRLHDFVIIPEDIGHMQIEYYLNPPQFCGYYSDKAQYPQYMDVNMPKIIIKRTAGGPLKDGLGGADSLNQFDFKSTSQELGAYIQSLGYNSVILKPSYGTNSGIGVVLFNYEDGVYKSSEGLVLDGKYLQNYGDYFVLQEAVNQSSFMKGLCSSSVNTIRAITYKSVEDDRVYVTSAAVRIGKDGQFTDNIHSGGLLIGVDVENGSLYPFLTDQYGRKYTKWNGIEFDKSSFIIPNWEKILEFAKKVASFNKHCRLLALDIALDIKNEPILIESNVEDFSYWIPQFLGQSVFGDKTEEVVNFIVERKKHSKTP